MYKVTVSTVVKLLIVVAVVCRVLATSKKAKSDFLISAANMRMQYRFSVFGHMSRMRRQCVPGSLFFSRSAHTYQVEK